MKELSDVLGKLTIGDIFSNPSPVIDKAVEVAMLNQATEDYNSFISGAAFKQIADDVARPDCFAYALANGHFTQDEMRKIPFSVGDSPTKYIATYGREGLYAQMRREFIKKVSEL